ncbi:uncharacterized protein LOC129749790 [Uranotaenia lowii]|uniref:uncharacterized protein LOC129749790 n=1 Tax=Uranotaenia lowii TaxID=190385 RepID=UPI0024793201|nr:uncharacterized protein LOC129749790 [Uranotaenia lowii]
MGLLDIPVEVFQIILSLLPFNELLTISQICHRCKQMADPWIVRKGRLKVNSKMLHHKNVIEKLTRNYLALDIVPESESVLPLLIDSQTPKHLIMNGFLYDHLFRFYQRYKRWFEQLEFLHVEINDRFVEYFTNHEEDYLLEIPCLKTLQWAESLLGESRKSIKIIAQNLDSVHFDDSSRYSANLKISSCLKLRRIQCRLGIFSQCFEHIFCDTSFETIQHIMIVNFVGDQLSYLNFMNNLQTIWLSIHPAEISILNNFSKFKNLKKLVISVMYAEHHERAQLNVTNLFRLSEVLNHVELSDMNILATLSSICLERLTVLKLINVNLCDDSSIINIFAPKLQVLSLPLDILEKFVIQQNDCLSKLCIQIKKTHSTSALKALLSSFLHNYSSVTQLALKNISIFANIDDLPANITNVRRLAIMGLTMEMKCFERIATWRALKHLSLLRCTVRCKNAEKSLVLSNVTSANICAVDFENVHSKKNISSCLFEFSSASEDAIHIESEPKYEFIDNFDWANDCSAWWATQFSTLSDKFL